MRWVGVLLPLILAVAAFFQVPIKVWIDMNQGLLAFLGLLAAALVQVIPVTANFLQSDRLTPTEAVRLSKQLLKQQRYWVGLLVSTVIAFALIVIVSILENRTVWTFGRLGEHDVGSVFSAIVTFAMSFVLIKTTAIVGGVMSLQTLRNELVLDAARRAAAEEIRQARLAHEARESQQGIPPIVPADYGSITRPS
ncbi:MAG: hypothetical protein ACRYGO_01450 [Janthinobacterium lividum]